MSWKIKNENGNYTMDNVKSGEIWEGEITYEQWDETYKVMDNHVKPINEKMFETYDAEWEYVKTLDGHNVWTWVSGDGAEIILAGFHFVNRMGYYVTEKPWTDENTTVLLSVEIECECFDQDKYDEGDDAGDPDCPECEGYGLRYESL